VARGPPPGPGTQPISAAMALGPALRIGASVLSWPGSYRTVEVALPDTPVPGIGLGLPGMQVGRPAHRQARQIRDVAAAVPGHGYRQRPMVLG
jgi:hypothetical protein